MASTVLERQPVSVLLVENDRPFRELAAKAHKSLQYGRLNTFLSQKDNGVALDETLAKLDIQPFKVSAVRAYQNEMLYGRFWSKHRRLADYVDSGSFVICFISAVAVTASITAYLAEGVSLLIIAPIVLVASILFVGGIKVNRSYNRTPIGRRFEWYQVELNDYSEAVPEFVLHTALRIQKLLPDARFFVEHLAFARASLREQRRARSLDPFLLVAHGDKAYFIEVWDEPKFEAENLYRS